MTLNATQRTGTSRRGAIAIGLFAMAMGIFPVLIGLGLMPQKPGEAPSWIGLLAGGIFMLAGAGVVVRGLTKADGGDDELAPASHWQRVFYSLVGLVTLSALATIGTWIALGSGARRFTASIPFVGSGPASEAAGRVAFGFGAGLVWICVIAMAISAVRRAWRRRAG